MEQKGRLLYFAPESNVEKFRLLVFLRVKAPTAQALDQLVQVISRRIGRYLERFGLLVRDFENSYLQLDAVDESAMDDVGSLHHLPDRLCSPGGWQSLHFAIRASQ
jgi:hypothetical protein